MFAVVELRQLRYFAQVARDCSMTRAAGKLRVAQPALSRQIRQLEEELGVALLQRTVKGVQLTAAGETFLTEAEGILARSEAAVRAAQLEGRREKAELNVGYVWGLFHTLAPAWIGRFRQRHPEVSVNLFDLPATRQAEALAQGRLHLGLIGFAFEADGARLAKRKVGECTFLAALPAKHPQARRHAINLSALAEDWFIVISDQTYPGAARVVREGCAAAGFQPRILQTAERGYTILGLVAANCGVTLLPESLQAVPHAGVVFRRLAEPLKADLYAAWKAAGNTPSAEVFLGCLG